MEKRGATRSGDGYADDNVRPHGGIGKDGSASPKDAPGPACPLRDGDTGATLIDVWENVPRAAIA